MFLSVFVVRAKTIPDSDKTWRIPYLVGRLSAFRVGMRISKHDQFYRYIVHIKGD